MAVAAIASSLQGCKSFANLETKIMDENTRLCACTNERYNEPNLSYTLSLSVKKNYIGENLFANFFSSLNRICTLANLMQLRQSPHLHRVANLVQTPKTLNSKRARDAW